MFAAWSATCLRRSQQHADHCLTTEMKEGINHGLATSAHTHMTMHMAPPQLGLLAIINAKTNQFYGRPLPITWEYSCESV